MIMKNIPILGALVFVFAAGIIGISASASVAASTSLETPPVVEIKSLQFRFPPPPPPFVGPARPEYYLDQTAPNCSYFLRSPGDRPTVRKVTTDVTYILVHKSGRKMALFSGDQVLKEYTISLGFNPRGHKQFEGDGRTPEGKYFIEYKNPNSEYNLSLKISYPNEQDRARARSQNQKPGDAIMIHGWPQSASQRRLVTQIHRMDARRAFPDKWTAGCIAVLDPEIEEMYPRIGVRTPIEICP